MRFAGKILPTATQNKWNVFTEMLKTLYLLAFSCRTLSCHNLEYGNPWDSRHSGSLGDLKCLPFLYDKDPVSEHIWKNIYEISFTNPILHRRVNKSAKGKNHKNKTIKRNVKKRNNHRWNSDIIKDKTDF